VKRINEVIKCTNINIREKLYQSTKCTKTKQNKWQKLFLKMILYA